MTVKRSSLVNDSSAWQQELAAAFTDIETLCTYLRLSPAELPISTAAASAFPLRVPRGFAACIEKGNPRDPLLLQVLPVEDELISLPGFVADPVGDLQAVAAHGVLHKYQGRALLLATGACAVHCRYCFRRNFPYAQQQLTRSKEDDAIAYVAAHRDIREVILSGGDPLLLGDERLFILVSRLSLIGHLQRLRIHSRLPVVLPGRVNDALIDTLTRIPQQVVLVLHSNHSNEISPAVAVGCAKLKAAGITLLNQSVLLKGVNDSAEQLCSLSEELFSAGVLPYYLHLLDRAAGTGHFEVEEAKAVAIMRQVRQILPGYLVPKLVREQQGALSKEVVA